MIKPHQGWEDYAELCEKEIEQLKNYTSLLLEEKRKAFQNGFGCGVIIMTIISMVIIALVIS